MTSPGAAEKARSATGPGQDQEARLAELYAAMGKVNIQALWTQAADLMPGQPAGERARAPAHGVGHPVRPAGARRVDHRERRAVPDVPR